jgi:hypothetical protein
MARKGKPRKQGTRTAHPIMHARAHREEHARCPGEYIGRGAVRARIIRVKFVDWKVQTFDNRGPLTYNPLST